MTVSRWRKYLWLWVIVGMIVVTMVISLIFFLINRCLSRAGKHRISALRRRSDSTIKSNHYQESKLKGDNPPLPPRTQFLTAEAQSYENLAEEPEYEQSTPDYEQDKADCKHDVADYEQSAADYEQIDADYEQDGGDYEQSTADYEQDGGDYVAVEDEEQILPPPTTDCKDPDPVADTISEDYDDIDDIQDEEDYDDVA